jgi:hypothetical protein
MAALLVLVALLLWLLISEHQRQEAASRRGYF